MEQVDTGDITAIPSLEASIVGMGGRSGPRVGSEPVENALGMRDL